MKTIVGKSPFEDNDHIGNSDCVFFEQSKMLVPVVGKHVHAIKCHTKIESPSHIERNTMYVKATIEFPIVTSGKIDLVMPDDIMTNEEYPEFPRHINNKNVELYNIKIVPQTFSAINAIAIRFNKNTLMYYLPEYNSMVCGNLGWHEHYITMFLQNVWQQIVDGVGLQEIDDAIIMPKTKNKISVLIGCDPELEMTKNGRVMKADRHLVASDAYSSKCGIGLDGQSAQVEIRPAPGTPAQVTRNIRNLIKKFSEDYPKYDLSSVGNKYPLGGHIHVGIGREYRPPVELVKLLDHFVGKRMLDMSGKARSNYKTLSAYREQPHGFEYRTPPGSAFAEPKIAFISMKIVKNICDKYFNEETIEYDDSHELPTIQDYVDVVGLTEKQAKYFVDFCERYKPSKSIRASWRMPPPEKNEEKMYAVDVEFIGDNWNSTVINRIEEFFTEFEFAKNGYKVSFYILQGNDTRSFFSTIPITNANCVQGSLPVWDGKTLNVGLSNYFTYEMTNSQYRALFQGICEHFDALEEVIA